MDMLKRYLSFVVLFLLLLCFVACKKDASGSDKKINQAQIVSQTSSGSVYYTNTRKTIYVISFTNKDTKQAFTTILLPNRQSAQLNLPPALTSGSYDVVITPEDALSGNTTQYTIGDINGSSNKYPVTIKNAHIGISNSKGPVVIVLN